MGEEKSNRNKDDSVSMEEKHITALFFRGSKILHVGKPCINIKRINSLVNAILSIGEYIAFQLSYPYRI